MNHQFEKHSSTNQSHSDIQERKKYAKLTPEIKQLFLKKIIFENLSIKEASQMLRINYSSAKAIASTHKKSKTAKNRKGFNKKTAKVCAYRSIDDNEQALSVSLVCSSVGKLVVSQHIIPKRKLISKSIMIACPIPIKLDIQQTVQAQ